MTGKDSLHIVKQSPQIIISCGGCYSGRPINNATPCFCCNEDQINEKIKNESNKFLNHISEYLHKISQGNPNQSEDTKYSFDKDKEFEYSKKLRSVKLKCASNCFGVKGKESSITTREEIIGHNIIHEQEIDKQNIKKEQYKKCLHVNINFVNQVNVPGTTGCVCSKNTFKTNKQCKCDLDAQENNTKEIFSKRSGSQYCVVLSPEGEATVFYKKHTEKSEKKKKPTRNRVLKNESEESLEEEVESSYKSIDDKLGSEDRTDDNTKKDNLSQSLTGSEDTEQIESTVKSGEGEEDEEEKSKKTSRLHVDGNIYDSEKNGIINDSEKGSADNSEDINKELLDSSSIKSFNQTEEKSETEIASEKKSAVKLIEETLEEKSEGISIPKQDDSSLPELLPVEKLKSESEIVRRDSTIPEEKVTAEPIRENSDSSLRDNEKHEEELIDRESLIISEEQHTEESKYSLDSEGETKESKSSLDEKDEIKTTKQSLDEDEKTKEKIHSMEEESRKSTSETGEGLKRSRQSIIESIKELSEAKSSEIYSLAVQSIESAKKNWTKDTEYLEREIGSYLIKSIAEIGFVKPSGPVNYLGERLYKYLEVEEHKTSFEAKQEDAIFNREMFGLTKQKIRTFNTLKSHQRKVKVTEEIPEEGGEPSVGNGNLSG